MASINGVEVTPLLTIYMEISLERAALCTLRDYPESLTRLLWYDQRGLVTGGLLMCSLALSVTHTNTASPSVQRR